MLVDAMRHVVEEFTGKGLLASVKAHFDACQVRVHAVIVEAEERFSVDLRRGQPLDHSGITLRHARGILRTPPFGLSGLEDTNSVGEKADTRRGADQRREGVRVVFGLHAGKPRTVFHVRVHPCLLIKGPRFDDSACMFGVSLLATVPPRQSKNPARLERASHTGIVGCGNRGVREAVTREGRTSVGRVL